MQLFHPMSPILTDTIPQGDDWGYQIKWDGYRVITEVSGGRVGLYSKTMKRSNNTFPELAKALGQLETDCVLDGEAVIFDQATKRPSFQKIQRRNKLVHSAEFDKAISREPVVYVLFDVLRIGNRDLRQEPFVTRFNLLNELFPERTPEMFTAELYEDGQALWQWVQENGWEGVVSKRLSSAYLEGKDHSDWFKRKTIQTFEVDIVGFLMREGRLASLLMRSEGAYFGRVSSGLDDAAKAQLLKLKTVLQEAPPVQLPPEMNRMQLKWLEKPVQARVKGQEVTEGGFLRQPKLLSIEGGIL